MHSNAENIFRWRPVLLFYTTLFITSFTLVLVLLWLYRLMASIGQRIYEARLPSVKKSPTAHINEKKYSRNSKLASRALDGKPHSTPANLAHKNLKQKEARRWKQNAGQVICSNRSGLSGQAYKPSQQAISTFALDKKNN